MVMKTVITLDPEYIPWEPGAPVVRLRRKRNKTLAAILGVGFCVLICGGMLFFAQQKQQAVTPPDLVDAAPVPTALPTLGILPTPALITQGTPGQLAIQRGNVVSFLPCTIYRVRNGDAVIVAEGDTASGPIVDVSDQQGVRIECENQVFEF